jgi:molecular chaperone DnaJ
VPPGVEEGMALRVPGHGYPASQKGAPSGDLLVIIRTAPDERFKRHGADLWREETVDLADAALGTNLKVPTLDGEAKVKVPAGTQPDTVLRLAGKGLPRFGAKGRGNLFIRVVVHMPETLSVDERKLFERLREISHAKGASEGHL